MIGYKALKRVELTTTDVYTFMKKICMAVPYHFFICSLFQPHFDGIFIVMNLYSYSHPYNHVLLILCIL